MHKIFVAKLKFNDNSQFSWYINFLWQLIFLATLSSKYLFLWFLNSKFNDFSPTSMASLFLSSFMNSCFSFCLLRLVSLIQTLALISSFPLHSTLVISFIHYYNLSYHLCTQNYKFYIFSTDISNDFQTHISICFLDSSYCIT